MSASLLGVAASVFGGLVLTVLVWVGATLISQLRATVALQTQVANLNTAIADLKLQLMGVQQFGDRIGRLETRATETERRITRLEDQPMRA